MTDTESDERINWTVGSVRSGIAKSSEVRLAVGFLGVAPVVAAESLHPYVENSMLGRAPWSRATARRFTSPIPIAS